MGNSNSSSDSEEDTKADKQDDEGTPEPEGDRGKDGSTNLDLQGLFESESLRLAATKVKEEMPENIIQEHQSTLVRWLEDRQQRNEETVTLAQFCDILMNRTVSREDCEQAFLQFDSEGDGTADVTAMLEALRVLTHNSIHGDLGYTVRTLQACSLTPGFLDVFCEDKRSLGNHGARILNFLLRNRASVSMLPFPILSGFNNTCAMRLAALKAHMAKMKESAWRQQEEARMLSQGEELKPITRCYKTIEVSTNKVDAYRLTNIDSSLYWQSDGAARSHWVRLRMRSNVVIKQLSIGVSSSDQSYMPQTITVAVGKSCQCLREIKEIRVPSHVTGDITILENCKAYYPIVQLNIKRCHTDGCDTRIHGLKTLGYRIVKEQEVSVLDASTGWYLQVLATTVSSVIPQAPRLRHNILQHTKAALKHIAPLSLSPCNSEKPAVFSNHFLKEIDNFLADVSKDEEGRLSADGLYVTLGFNLARGHVAGVLNTLLQIKEYEVSELPAANLLVSMETVRDNYWKRMGGPLQMSLCGCDGGKKEDGTPPESVLTNIWSGTQAYTTSQGKTLVNMFFKTSDHVQLTKVRIKVDRGQKGAKRGMVFVYKESGEFDLDKHVAKFKGYDSWTATEYTFCQKVRASGIGGKPDNPVGYFTLEDDWDEVEVPLDLCPVGQYVLVKFLEPRQSSADKLSIVGIKFQGFQRYGTFVADNTQEMEPILGRTEKSDSVSSETVALHCLQFLVALARDYIAGRKSSSHSEILDLTGVSVDLVWKLYSAYSDAAFQSHSLQLLHALLPALANGKDGGKASSEGLFKHLCAVVDNTSPSSPLLEHLVTVTKQVIIDGAAVFFPDKEARRKQLFRMMNDINATTQSASVSLIFQSLCQFFSSVDPSGLLDLPSTIDENFNTDPVMAVMETLLAVAFREFQKILSETGTTEQASHLVHLYCSLQTSLLAWCHQMSDLEKKVQAQQAEGLLSRYVDMVAGRATEAFSEIYKAIAKFKLLHQEPATETEEGQEKEKIEAKTEKPGDEESEEDKTKDKGVTASDKPSDEVNAFFASLEGSFMATAFRQMVLMMSSLNEQISSRTRRQLLASLHPTLIELNKVSAKLPQMFFKVESPHWRRLEAGEVVLRTWEMESPHNYDNNQNTTQTFSCPGATTFIVNFDARCETEKRYDYLEFTDWRGVKTRLDQKVNSEKWPNRITFRGGHRLQFLFHSDGTNNEWGYKFKVTAMGCPDVPLCWMFDLQLSILSLHGSLCGKTLASNKLASKQMIYSNTADDIEAEQLRHLLWMTLFRGGYMVGKLQRSLSGKHEALSDTCVRGLLWSLVDDEIDESSANLAADFIAKCREHCTVQNIGGPEVSEAVNAIFAALLWHTQALREELEKYVKAQGGIKIPEGIYQAYNVAESMRTMLMDQRQKWKVIVEESDGTTDLPNPVTPCREKALFLLKFAGLSKVLLKSESKGKLNRQTSRHARIQGISIERSIKLDGVMDRYPSFRLVLEFVRDPAWSKDKVEEVLEERLHQAEAVASAYMTAAETLRIHSDEQPFQVPSVVFLQAILAHQEHFPQHYADGLDGCGLLLETQVRRSYYAFMRRIVDSLKTVKRNTLPKPVMMAYDYVQACTLHFIDVNWQLYDLSFLVDINLPELYINLAKGSVSVREKHTVELDETKELEDYQRDLAWLQECNKDFQTWYTESEKLPSPERKEMQMFIARFCDLLEVEINCNACDLTLPGHRYRCLKCLDTDYCSTCYASGVTEAGGQCNEHEIVHLMYKCDDCKAFIVGTRIHCKQCEDFDLCLGCHERCKNNTSSLTGHGHSPDHEIARHTMTTWKQNKDCDMSMLSYLHQHAWLLMTSLALSMSHLIYQTKRPDSSEVDVDYVNASVSLHNSCIELVNACLMQVNMVDSIETAEEDDSPEGFVQRQQEAFAVHSQERIVGLLGAMVPPENKVPISDDVNTTFTSQKFLHMLFTIARGMSGHESNTQHMAMGLVGQLLQRSGTTCSIADSAIALATEKPVKDNQPEGQHTVEFLFNFGATCLERSGLEWAHSMAGILQRLFNSVMWREILLQHVTLGIHTLTQHTQSSLGEHAAAMFTKADSDKDSLINEEEMAQALQKYALEEEEIKILWEVCRLPQVPKMEGVGFSLAVQVCDIRGSEDMPRITKPAAAAALLREREEEEFPELSNIFALFVIAGFPEVLSLGSHVRYSDVSTEMKDGVVLKHSPVKKTSLVIDKKSRKRIWVHDEFLEIVSFDSHVLDKEHMVAFIDIVKDIGVKVRAGHKVCVENLWVLSLAMKTLLHSLQAAPSHDMPELVSPEFLQSVVHLAGMGTRFSREWLLRDLEILSLTLYTRDREKEKDSDDSQCKTKQDSSTEKGLSDNQVNFMNLLKQMGLPEPDEQSVIFDVIKKFELSAGNLPSSNGPSKAGSDLTIDTGMQIDMSVTDCNSTLVEVATPEPCEAAQKLILSADNSAWSDTIKLRKSKSVTLLRKELDAQGKAAPRDFLVKVNTALSVLYARNLLMTLLADWPAEGHVITAQLIGCKDSSQVPFVLDLLNHTEVKDAFAKVVTNVICRSPEESLVPLALTACCFMSEVNLTTVVKESPHNYKDSTNFEDKIHIPGATVLAIKFDARCITEETCDVLVLSTSPDYTHDKHSFSGTREQWIDFELPGDTIYYKFTSDCSNNEWGYRFTVTGGKIGRFDTGYCILNSILSVPELIRLLPIGELWPRLVQVACKQYGLQRMKSLQLMLRMMSSQFKSAGCQSLQLDLGLLCPLWALYNKMSSGSSSPSSSITSPVVRALTEFFLLAENLAMEWGIAENYKALLLLKQDIHKMVFQGMLDVAAVSRMILIPSDKLKALFSKKETKDKDKDKDK